VLVIFVVAAIALVAVGTRPSVSGVAATTTTTTTTTTNHSGTTSTTTTTTVPHSSVSVQVANATGAGAVAAHYSSVLSAQGWATKPPANATTTVPTSSVYYAAGQQASAAAIAAALGIKSTAVLPLTASVPVTGATGNDVVVVIGTDLAAAAGT
jgi:hypothetical protein